MQLYEGLPITTNKIPASNRKGIPHHLLGCVGLGQQPWTVRQYSRRAREVVDNIRSRNKLPIVVGGTSYYVQSLFAPDTLLHNSTSDSEPELPSVTDSPILCASTSEMYQQLRILDPNTASRLHPRDRRKIQRSLEVSLQKGRPASQIYAEQKAKLLRDLTSHNETIESRHFDDFLVFWTHASALQLHPRLDQRVDAMVAQGLLEEAESLHQFAQMRKAQGSKIDESHGIWTAIGYKELLPFITDPCQPKKVKVDCIERTKISTRQYAKRQNRWIRLKLLPTLFEAGHGNSTFLLEPFETSSLHGSVETLAVSITDSFLSRRDLPHPRSLSDLAADMLQPGERLPPEARICQLCEKTLMTQEQWNGHLKSKGHRIALRPKVDWKALHPSQPHPAR